MHHVCLSTKATLKQTCLCCARPWNSICTTCLSKHRMQHNIEIIMCLVSPFLEFQERDNICTTKLICSICTTYLSRAQHLQNLIQFLPHAISALSFFLTRNAWANIERLMSKIDDAQCLLRQCLYLPEEAC